MAEPFRTTTSRRSLFSTWCLVLLLRGGISAVAGGLLTLDEEIPIHIYKQQRNGRKSITSIVGLPTDLDVEKITKAPRKEFECSSCVKEEPKMMEQGLLQSTRGDKALWRSSERDYIFPCARKDNKS